MKNCSDSVSNAPVVSTIIDNLLLPSRKFYKICCQLNQGQQHLFNFTMQYALHFRLAEKNNESPPKPFQIFKWRYWRWKKLFNQGSNWIIKTSSETSKPNPWSTICCCECIYWKSCYRYPWYYILHFISLLSQDWNPSSIKSQVMKLFICWETNIST